jgi:hypothetical protein
MNKEIKIFILALAIAILLIAFFIWRDYRITEKKYQACFEICNLENPVFEDSGSLEKFIAERSFRICELDCKEDYGR